MFEEFLSLEKVNLTKILLRVLGGKCEGPGEGRTERRMEGRPMDFCLKGIFCWREDV